MAEAAQTARVLARMVRRPEAVAERETDLARVLGLAAMRAAQELYGLRLALGGAEADAAGGEALAQGLEAPVLMLRLDRPDATGEAPAGVLALCPQLLAGLIEVQTTGTVRAQPSEARAPTETDAAMAEAFAEGLLARFAVLTGHLPDPPPVAGLALDGRFHDPGAAAMTLAEGEHLRWRLKLEMAGGARVGTLVLAVAPPEVLQPKAADPVWRQSFERAVLASPATLRAELARLRLPLAEVGAFEAGTVVPLGAAALDGVTLGAPGGAPVAQARLGRAGGQRAVRILDIPGAPSSSPAAPKPASAPAAAVPETGSGVARVTSSQDASGAASAIGD